MNSQSVVFEGLDLAVLVNLVSCSSIVTVVAGISADIDGTIYTYATAYQNFQLGNVITYGGTFYNVTLYQDSATHIAEIVNIKFLVNTHLIRHGVGVWTNFPLVPSLLPSILSKLTYEPDV